MGYLYWGFYWNHHIILGGNKLNQVQKSGKNSRNIQVAGNITINSAENDKSGE